jgi:hypothetical protein
MFCVSLIILFSGITSKINCYLLCLTQSSGFAVFFPGNFSVSGFLTYYINIAIFAGVSLNLDSCLKISNSS